MDENRFISWTKKEESWELAPLLVHGGLMTPIPVVHHPPKRKSENDSSPNRPVGATEGASPSTHCKLWFHFSRSSLLAAMLLPPAGSLPASMPRRGLLLYRRL